MLAKTPSLQGADRLAARRRRARTRLSYAVLVLVLILIAAGLYAVWLPSLRVRDIHIYGADESLAGIASSTMEGSYLRIIPRDSIFFFPAHAIRMQILSYYPDIAAVSIFEEGFTGLSIKIIDRVPIARWCGTPASTSSPTSLPLETTPYPTCYLFDDTGLLYSPASSTDANLVTPYALFAPLSTSTPQGASVSDEQDLPALFDFARQAGALASPVSAIVIRGDEVDDFLVSGTRITYIRGQESVALDELVSAAPNLTLTASSTAYVDLRFPGKVYVKAVTASH